MANLNRNSRTMTGIDDFEKFLNHSEIFVDKTLFIREFVNTTRDKIIVARPKKWGKTLNFDMCRKFLQIEVDENGQPKYPTSENPTAAYELFMHEKAGKKLAIMKDDEFVKQNLGQHPVISFSLKEADGDNVNEMSKSLLAIIGPLFSQYDFLLNNLNKDWVDYKEFMAIMNKERDDIFIVRNSLGLLIRLLHNHFGGKKVFVLIDDYDVIFHKILLDWKDPDEIRRGITTFGRMILKAFDSPFKNKVLAAGNVIFDSSIMEIDGCFADLMYTNKFAEAFGLTTSEAQWAMRQYGMIGGNNQQQQSVGQQASGSAEMPANLGGNLAGEIDDAGKEENSKKMFDWYNGYGMPELNTCLSNPESFFKQLVDYDLRKETGTHPALRPSSWWLDESIIFPKIRECLIRSKTSINSDLHKIVDEEFEMPVTIGSLRFSRYDFEDLRTASEAAENDKIAQNKFGIQLLVKFLFSFGLVSINKTKSPIKLDIPKYHISVPNHEARYALLNLLYETNKRKWNLDDAAEPLLDKALFDLLDNCTHEESKSCDMTELETAMTKMIQPMRFVDILHDHTGVHENEFLFQLIISYRAMKLMNERNGKFGGEVYAKNGEIEKDENEPKRKIVTAKRKLGFRSKLGRKLSKNLPVSKKVQEKRAESKKGQDTRADTVYSLNNVAIIIETKHDRSQKPNRQTGETLACKGLDQIFDRRYDRIFRNDANIKVIKSIGLSAGISRGGDEKFICIYGCCETLENLVQVDDTDVGELAEEVAETEIGDKDDAASLPTSTAASTSTRMLTRAAASKLVGIGQGPSLAASNPQLNKVYKAPKISVAVGEVKDGKIKRKK